MNFTKMHALGNDYVVINTFKENITAPEPLARKLCEWNFGIGADGLLLQITGGAFVAGIVHTLGGAGGIEHHKPHRQQRHKQNAKYRVHSPSLSDRVIFGIRGV